MLTPSQAGHGSQRHPAAQFSVTENIFAPPRSDSKIPREPHFCFPLVRPVCLSQQSSSHRRQGFVDETNAGNENARENKKTSRRRSKRIGPEDVRFVASKKPARKKAYSPRVLPRSPPVSYVAPFFCFPFGESRDPPRVWHRHPLDVHEKNRGRKLERSARNPWSNGGFRWLNLGVVFRCIRNY